MDYGRKKLHKRKCIFNDRQDIGHQTLPNNWEACYFAIGKKAKAEHGHFKTTGKRDMCDCRAKRRVVPR
jgi:hypothetical protein